MKRQEWLLLAIGDEIQPIQLQKTMFKFAMESKVPTKQKYSFEAYNWGPCSFEVYEDLEALRSHGLLGSRPTGRGWNYYMATLAGAVRQESLRSTVDPSHLERLDEAREYVVSRDFGTLLHDIYAEYPSYAVNSLFTECR